jgi:predicted esterase
LIAMTMDLQTIELNPGAAPRATVIVLHGLGADGTDFLPMADELQLDAVGPVRFVFPRAPVRPVTLNNGYPMRAWYDILGTDLARREDESGLRASMAAVHRLIDREQARGMPAQRIVLAGFSQGCAITLGAGLRCGQRLAGLAGLSGYLPLADTTAAERRWPTARRRSSWPMAARRRGAAGAWRGGARPAAGPGPAAGVARLPDGAQRLHRRGAGVAAMAAARAEGPG